MIRGIDPQHPDAGPHNHFQWGDGACRECCHAEQDAERKKLITKRPEDCAHTDFTCRVDVNRLEDVQRFVADVAIWCLHCGLPFSFTGFPLGISMERPTLSIDATEARLPLEPGPKPIPLNGTYRVEVPRRTES